MATASIKLYNSSDQEVSEFQEADIVAGDCYVEITLSGDTWIAAGGSAPSYRSKGAATQSADSAISSLPIPTGVQQNDIVIALYFSVTDDSSVDFATAGFSALANGGGTGYYMRLYWKRAGASESNYNIPSGCGASGYNFAQTFAYSGCTTSGNPYTGTPTVKANASSTTVSTTATVPTVDNSLIVMFAACDNTYTASGWTGGSLTWTEDSDNTVAGPVQMAAAGSAPQSTAASIAPSCTLSSAIANCGGLVALKPV